MERTGSTAAAARRRLSEACRDRGRTDGAAEITPTTTVAALAERWFAQVQAAVDVGDYSPGTSQEYRDRLDKQVGPALGALLVGEVTVGIVDRLLHATRDRHGAAVAKTTRTVLSGMLGLAARQGWRSIEVPSWCAQLLDRRRSRPANRWDAVFTSHRPAT